ncbi:unnamed protein product [Adineta steineri]|uniref:Uncharacterized protein n=2 Tax=Adineta steineri TaxID=433720 RepID=A0A815S9Q5_9BILA|nr:unnamed protein product [Adineta steineri]
MSRIHFLADNSKHDFHEDLNSSKKISKDSISYSRQGWQYLIQRILNDDFSNELQILQLKLDSNIFQQYQHSLIDEYRIQENNRINKIQCLSFLLVPNRKAIRSIFIRVASMLHYSIINMHVTHIVIIPLVVVQLDTVMKLSTIEDQTI